MGILASSRPFLSVILPGGRGFLKGSNSEASADNLPEGFLTASSSIYFLEVSTVNLPVGMLRMAASVITATFTAAVRNSELSVVFKVLALGAIEAFAAAVWSSACCLQ